MGLKDRIPPALVLFLLSPVIGELLSGSSPPAEFFTVFGFTIMSLLYGGGAILCREIKVRWGKGIGSLLLLGAAYGVVEEGLMVASFQNPYWMDLDILGTFGRVWGVNWVWAVELTAYHAFVSIIVPVLLVEQMYPERKNKAWLSERWCKIVPVLFLFDVVVGYILFAFLSGFWAPLPQYVFFIIVTIVFVMAAKRLPSDWARRGQLDLVSPMKIYIISTAAAFACGVNFWVLPNALPGSSFPVVILTGLGIISVTLRCLTSYDWNNSRSNHWLSLASGALSPLILFSMLQEFDESRVDDTSGMLILGLSFAVFLLALWNNNRVKA